MTQHRTWDEIIAETREQLRTKTGRKRKAQETIMDGIGNVLGYWRETHADLVDAMTDEEQDEFSKILYQQADRVARMFGYEQAWGN